MYNLQLHFTLPWVLLLLIPAIALTLIPYFRLSKRHRRTRNRITSIVLHIIVMTLAILAFSGITFSYQIPNEENEIILLVDVSDSEETTQQERDEFIELVLQQAQYDGYKVGIVTFGYDQEYAVPLTYDIDSIFDTYLDAPLPDVTATNIASALTYTRDLFQNKQSAKIVLITDGKETDEDASLIVRSVTSQGIKVDTAYIGKSNADADVLVLGAELPEYHLVLEEEYSASITLYSEYQTTATLEMLDNGESVLVKSLTLSEGSQTVELPLVFKQEGLHELLFKVTVKENDALIENNVYYSYHYLQQFNDILILETFEGESQKLVTLLNANQDYEITVQNIKDSDRPYTLEALCQYDQVILNNISNKELKVNAFDELLETYVKECGGGLFTIGGDREENGKKVANAYNRSEMYGSIYQDMLPVEVINYTPPLGVMVLMDISGSMGGGEDGSGSKLEWAKAGVEACLEALTVRDFIGVMTFDDFQDTILELTPRTHEAKIKEALNVIKDKKPTGGTVSKDAVIRAGQALLAQKNVDKRHIILVTDGGISNIESVIEQAKVLYEEGVTISVVGIGVSSTYLDSMEKLVETGHGRLIIEEPGEALANAMKHELQVDPLKEVEDEEFNPLIKNVTSPLVRELAHLETEGGTSDKKLALTLDGFYGVKAKVNADVILTNDNNVPIYAQWKYGNGMVGSFMCDLNGGRSADFMSNTDGATFVQNVVNNLMPLMDIRPNDITVSIKEDNYTNKLSVYTSLNEGESLKGAIYDANGNLVVDMNTTETEGVDLSNLAHYTTLSLSEANKYSRCNFVIKEGGVYRIEIVKYDANDNEIARLETYKSFSYSEEYDTFLETQGAVDGKALLQTLAEKGNGAMIEDMEDPWEIFEGFVTDIDKTFDPRFLFMILAIVLFLLDIIVRKFKFKWPHELIRDYKAKRAEGKANNPS